MSELTLAAALTAAIEQLTPVSDTAVLDAEVLLCHCLEKNRSYLRAWPERLLGAEQLARYQVLLAERQRGVPVAYLTGVREFWSREFQVDSNVLIPRPDTELLIELALAQISAKQACKLLDLGTGSGIIAITLAAERPLSWVTATDRSFAALRVARANAQRLQVDNVSFVASDWLAALGGRDFALILSNPPYIAAADPHLQQGDVRFEPLSALVAADDGLADIRQIVAQARTHLSDGGCLLIEHGYDQETAVQAIFRQFNYQNIHTHRDLADNPRVTSGLWFF